LHDPSIGRFLSVDPLSEKYDYNSSYAFSENKVTGHIELEGLEAVPAQTQLYRAAGFSNQLNDKENSDLGKKLLGMWLEAQATVTLMMLPLEEAIFGGLGLAAKELGGGLKMEAAFIKGGSATTKEASVAENIIQGEGKFIVSEKGTAASTSQTRMKEGFENAGLPSKPTNSPGTEYTLPDGRKVRTMEASGQAPKRASFENKNGQPVDIDGKTVNPPKELTIQQRKDFIRDRTHIKQD